MGGFAYILRYNTCYQNAAKQRITKAPRTSGRKLGRRALWGRRKAELDRLLVDLISLGGGVASARQKECNSENDRATNTFTIPPMPPTTTR